MRTVTATVTEPTEAPREGLAVFFDAPDGNDDVIALTDASGPKRDSRSASMSAATLG